MLLHIRHETIYRYERPVKYSIQHLRLTPRAEANQRIIDWHIVSPGRKAPQTDAYGNIAHMLTLDQPHHEVSIIVSGTVETDEHEAHRVREVGTVPPLAYLTETTLTAAD